MWDMGISYFRRGKGCPDGCEWFDLTSWQIILALLLFAFFGSQPIYCQLRKLFWCGNLRCDLPATLLNTLLLAFFLWLFGLFTLPYNGYEILLISVVFFLFNNLRFLTWANFGCPRLQLVRGRRCNKRGFWGVGLGMLLLAIILFWGAAGLQCPAFTQQWTRGGMFVGGPL